MRLLMSAAMIVLGISSGVGCRMCDSCYEHGPVINGASSGCANCGDQSVSQPYYSQPSGSTIVPEMAPVQQP